MSPRSSKRLQIKDDARRLVVSFHDLHPGSRDVCEKFLDRLREMGIERISLLVVPRWHGDRSIDNDPQFAAWLRTLAADGHDLCLHGFFHRADSVSGGLVQRLIGRVYTNSEGEFYQIGASEAAQRIKDGLEILGKNAGLPIVGFTPPAWLISEGGRQALVDAGLHYSTTFGSIDLLQAGKSLPAPTVVYSCRNAWRRLVSRIWVRFWSWRNSNVPILRVAAHPGDFKDPKVEASLYARIRDALDNGRTAICYRDLVEPDPAPVPVPVG